MPPRVVVTDAEELSVLAVCRGLAAGGYRVTAVAGKEQAAAHWSRSCSEAVVGPNPVTDPQGFVDFLRQLVVKDGYDVLMHGGEGSLLAISEHRAALEPHVKVGLPPHDAVLRSVDRVLLLELAAQAGLPPPESVVCANEEDTRRAAAALGFPVCVKPAQSLLLIDGVLTHRSLTTLENEAGLSSVLADYTPPFILQRFWPGAPVLSCSGLWAGGRLLGATTSRARRTYPPEAGTFSYVETVSPPEHVLDRVGQVVEGIGWEGLFQVDILEGPDGHGLVDFNPRPYRSLALDIKAGANLPALWCDWLLGGDPQPVRGRPGFRYRWESGELQHAMWQLRRRRFRAAGAVFVPRRRTTHTVFALHDPGPFASRLLYRLGLRASGP
jgi:predicted ATP-grasp superfamily ATP-dependent carboligase